MLRNKEIRRFAVWYAGIAVLSALAGFALSAAAGVLSLCTSAAFGAAFFAFTKARYHSIGRLSQQIDRVLHNADQLLPDEEREGELSILQSEIVKMTRRIREQNDALKREKENLADSLADIAHQLRTPLTSLTLILSLLENAPEEGQRAQLLREADELLRRMDWLLTSLLKLSRLDAGVVSFVKEPVNVKQLIQAALRPLQISMELHDITVKVAAPEGAFLPGDPGWLSEALQNILKNAMESAGDHGVIEIACESNPLYTAITIHDSGPGFDGEQLPRLFDRFYRGKASGAAGYGIGLALCKTIVTRQGGAVTARNHAKGGAVFTIRFPK